MITNILVCGLPGSGNRLVSRQLVRMGANAAPVLHCGKSVGPIGAGQSITNFTEKHPAAAVGVVIPIREQWAWLASVAKRYGATEEQAMEYRRIARSERWDQIEACKFAVLPISLTLIYSDPPEAARRLADFTSFDYLDWPEDDYPKDCDAQYRA